MPQLTEVSFLFDMNVRTRLKVSKSPWKVSDKFGQIRITAPSYKIAKLMAEQFAGEILESEFDDEDPTFEYMVLPELGCFSLDKIDTFEQNKIRYSEP